MYAYQQYATEYLPEWVEIWGLGLEVGVFFQKRRRSINFPPPCTTCSRFSIEKREIKVKSTFT